MSECRGPGTVGDSDGDSSGDDTVWDEVIVNRATRVGFVSLDRADLISIFKLRASVMKSPPKFLRGACRSAIRVALTVADYGVAAGDEVRLCRAWKLFLLLPRMLHKPARGGLIPKGS